MFKFKKNYLLIVAILICGISIMKIEKGNAIYPPENDLAITESEVSNITNNSARVYWQSNAGIHGEYRYSKNQADLDLADLTWETINVINGDATGNDFGSMVNIINLKENTKYYFEVRQGMIYGASGDYLYGDSKIVEFKTKNDYESSPHNISVKKANKNLMIEWNDPSDGSAVGFNIYRSENKGQQGDLLHYFKDTCSIYNGCWHIDENAQLNKEYFYTVKSVNPEGAESTNSDQYKGIVVLLESEKPDLIIKNIHIDGHEIHKINDKKYDLNKKIKLSIAYYNQGGGISEKNKIGFYYDGNLIDKIDTHDRIGLFNNSSSNFDYWNYNYSSPIEFTLSDSGNHVIKAIIDDGNIIDEQDENNNSKNIDIQIIENEEDSDLKILDVEAVNITYNTTNILWKTNIPTHFSYVWYGEEDTANGRNFKADSGQIYYTEYKMNLINLKSNTKYYFRITSEDKNGKKVESKSYNFTTKQVNSDLTTKDKNIIIHDPRGTFYVNDTAKLYWETNDSYVCSVNYSEDINFSNHNTIRGRNISTPSTSFSDGKYHYDADLINLDKNISYYYKIVCGVVSNKTYNESLIKKLKFEESGNTISCTDSDGGKNYYVKGISNGFTDSCIGDTNMLNEFWCDGNEPKHTAYTCLNGCKDGACIKEDIIQINNNASNLFQNKLDTILIELNQLRDIVKEQQTQIKYLAELKKGIEQLSQTVENAINNFITYGVDSNTKKLGAGERAAVMHSFKSAFNKLPETEEELADAIKIANGRWPSLRSNDAEKQAKEQFQKIYKRIADMNNANDNAAITIMAYGLRQKAENRNLESERQGIKTFQNIYGYHPNTTEDWNIMQSITYSGSSRGIDTDGDLLTDKREKELGTDSNNPDTDGDGYLDGVEVANGFDPLVK